MSPVLPRILTLTNHLKSARGLLTLSLPWNLLSDVPACIAQLPSLTKLDLSNNQLKRLPADLGQMSTLTWLDLSANALEEFLDNTRGWTSMRHLYMYNNCLKTLPVSFAPVLAKLQSFDCSKNPLLVGAF